MKIRHSIAASALLLCLAACSSTNVVDGKAVVEVPNPSGSPTTVTCYLLEIDRQAAGSEESTDETYICVTREEWERNHLDEEWVDSNGLKK